LLDDPLEEVVPPVAPRIQYPLDRSFPSTIYQLASLLICSSTLIDLCDSLYQFDYFTAFDYVDIRSLERCFLSVS
jgi:hypothetical protein